MIPLSYNLRSLTTRRTTTLATAIGVGLVVFVLASSLMLQAGIARTMSRSGRSDTAIVLRKGGDAELGSSIDEPTVSLIKAAPGVAKGPGGEALAIGEVVVVAFMTKSDKKGSANVAIRGVPPEAMAFRPEIRIVEGRPARVGVDEVIVGRGIVGQFEGLALGQRFEVRKGRQAEVVGVFESGGSSFESEVWGDIDTVRSSFGRQGIVSSIRVRLESPDRFEAFEAAVEQDKRLGLEALRELAFYEKQSEGTAVFIGVLGIAIAFFASLGAIIGAMITMYAAVAGRVREVGVLRALGFSRGAVLASFLLESTFLALLGGLLGVVASLGMGFVRFSMMNMASWSQMVFEFHPTPAIILTALLAGTFMGVLGGFLPAIRASRVSPTEAMRG